MQIVFKPIGPDQQAQALDLWHTVFGVPRDFFARYYAADPWYREGDSLGAWMGDELVSAVHVCRRPLPWEGKTLLCGGVANVATHPEYRSRGLSRRLLSMLTDHMREGGFALSTLGTGIPDFYAAQGWESLPLPLFELTIAQPAPRPGYGLVPAVPTDAVMSFYARSPRTLQLERPTQYFAGWVGWDWASEGVKLLTVPGGYLALETPTDTQYPVHVQEWRAGDAATELLLLREAVALANAEGRPKLTLTAQPQHSPVSVLEQFGVLEKRDTSGEMIRRLNMPEDDFERLRALYLSGQAVWWYADRF